MKLLPGLVLLLAAGCADTNAELPPVEIGGASGARLMTGTGKNPEESYEIAFAQLHKQHLNVRRALEARGRNLYGASLSMQAILDAFERMRSLVTAPYQAKFDPWIAKYKDKQKQIERDTWGGSFLQDFEFDERRINEVFNISNVELVQAMPAPAPKESTAPAPVARPVEPATPRESSAIPPDKVVPPPTRPAPAPVEPAAAPAGTPEKTAPAPAPVPAAGGRIYYKAWDGFHDALVAAYKATPRADCRPKYEDVMESLRLLKGTLPADRGVKLQIYIDYYSGLNDKTKTFTVLPEKTTDKDILDELDVVARVLRKEFNPDR